MVKVMHWCGFAALQCTRNTMHWDTSIEESQMEVGNAILFIYVPATAEFHHFFQTFWRI